MARAGLQDASGNHLQSVCENSIFGSQHHTFKRVQGLKPNVYAAFSARLKSCPDTCLVVAMQISVLTEANICALFRTKFIQFEVASDRGSHT
jgi:hypothetical protein